MELTLWPASTTISTVGYGDVSVFGGDEEPPRWRVFIGIVYMILCMVFLVTTFASVTGMSGNPLDSLQDWGMQQFGLEKNAFLYQRVRRVTFIKLGIIFFEFFLLNLVGIFVARIFVLGSDNDDEQWTWMTTFYWSVQTTTTIGYGDLAMPYNMRWFQIFYLVISTYFVGDSLGRLGSLRDEIHEIRREYAWSRREVSKGMLEDMQADDHDDVIDQYEYIVGSLLSLNKISLDDITPIMEQFRTLAGKDGVISLDDVVVKDVEEIDEHEADAAIEAM